jgi:hypothetical protein
MKRTTAARIAKYLQVWAGRDGGPFKVRRLRAAKPLVGFHQWADGKPLISADHIEREDGDSILCLVIDWKRIGAWYIVACSSTTHAPLAEVWRESGDGELLSLDWTYKPAKRDGRNPERTEYFRAHVGDLTMNLSVPSSGELSPRFMDDLFALVDNRLKADQLSEDEPEVRDAFPEGEAIERRHLARERSPALIRLAKALAVGKGGLLCQVCGFDFRQRYGNVGQGYIEAHHTVPVKDLPEGAKTRVEDIALVCANCHRMLHRKRPWLSMGQLKDLIVNGGAG